MSGHLLLISFHFGADGATGGFRWFEMSRDLAALGWSIDVLSGAAGATAAADDAIHVVPVQIPGWAKSYERGVRSTLNTLSRIRRLRAANDRAPGGNTHAAPAEPVVWRPEVRRAGLSRLSSSLLDSGRLCEELAWNRRVYATALELVRRQKPDAIVVSSPPHSQLIAGARLSAQTGVPLVCDFRDPWIAGLGRLAAYPTDLARIHGQRHESAVMRAASLVLFNTGHMADETVRSLGPNAPQNWAVVPNGSDRRPPAGRPARDRFIVGMTGHLHPYMDPRPLFAACARLRQREPARSAAMQIHFMGTSPEFGGVSLAALAAQHNLQDRFILTPRSTRDESRALQERSAVLALFDSPHGIPIPMKFYDYVQVRGQLLLLGWPGGALAAAAERVGLAIFPPDDAASVDATLDAALARWEADQFDLPVDAKGIFARELQSRRVHELLIELRAAKSKREPERFASGETAPAH